MRAEHADIRAAESVDALLRVADRAQARAAVRQAHDHVDAHLVGILELIDHDEPERMRVFSSYGRMVFKRAVRLRDEVGVVENAGLALDALECGENIGCEAAQGREMDPRRSLQGVQADLGEFLRPFAHVRGIGVVALPERPFRHGKSLEDAEKTFVGAFRPGREQLVELLLAPVQRGFELTLRRAVVQPCKRWRDRASKVERLLGEHDRRRARARIDDGIHARRRLGRRLRDIHQHVLDRRASMPCRARRICGEQRVDRTVGRSFFVTDQHLFNRLGERVGDEAVGSHLEIRIDAEFQGVLAQDAGAGAMNGGYPGGIDLEGLFRKPLGAQRAFDARLDLARRLVGEGDGHDLVDGRREGTAVGTRPVEQRPGDALGQRERLAAARTRSDEQRRVQRFDADALIRIECILVHASPSSANTMMRRTMRRPRSRRERELCRRPASGKAHGPRVPPSHRADLRRTCARRSRMRRPSA